jgi:Protein of unknown function (DUF2795)
MASQRSAELQVLLEGVPLPASKQELVAHARRHDAEAARFLEPLPDREYRSLDEVGEALAPVQPPRRKANTELPREESGEPPGGAAYVDPAPGPGAIRDSAPPWNPPQKTLEQQTQTQNEQQQRQEEELPG